MSTIRSVASPTIPRPSRPPRDPVELPRDEGSHPDAKTEWWYLNGHLRDEQGRKYGFMYALFDAPDVIDGRYNHDLPGMPSAATLDTGLLEEDTGRHSSSRTLRIGTACPRFCGTRDRRLGLTGSSQAGPVRVASPTRVRQSRWPNAVTHAGGAPHTAFVATTSPTGISR